VIDFDSRIENLEEDLKANLVKAMDAMGSDPTTATIRAYSAAKKALDTFQATQPQAESGERFKNIEQAAAWIPGAGYLVSARTVRNHADRFPGFPRKQKDGSYLKSEVAAYAAQTWENPSKPVSPADEEVGDDHKKRYLKEQADKLSLSNEITRKNYILRSDVEQRCSAAASFLKKDLSNFGPRICDQLIDVLSDYLRGKGLDLEDINMQAVIPDLLDEYDKKLDNWLNRYAQSTQFGAEIE
jgi:hypothetical protein